MKREEIEVKSYKGRLIIGLIVTFVIMAIAYIPLAYKTKLKEYSDSNAKDWNIESKILASNIVPNYNSGTSGGGASSSTGNENGEVTEDSVMEKFKPYTIGNTMYFAVEFSNPGDYIVYDVVVSNNGRIDSVLNQILVNIDNSNNTKEAIKYKIEGIEKGNILKAGEKKNFKVKVYWDKNIVSVNEVTNSMIIVNLDFVQY